jgi:uncharacterized protein (TIGR02646 family)
MVELEHGSTEPQALVAFKQQNPQLQVADFDANRDFQAIKRVIRQALNQLQESRCVYCETRLVAGEGHIEHIQPKSGPNAQPSLCFEYTNFAHSCSTPNTCGQKKKAGVLPISPGPGCNDDWTLGTEDGAIQPLTGLNRRQRHKVTQTRDMLGLNKHAELVRDRKAWIDQFLVVAKHYPEELARFIDSAPYRYLLATLLR